MVERALEGPFPVVRVFRELLGDVGPEYLARECRGFGATVSIEEADDDFDVVAFVQAALDEIMSKQKRTTSVSAHRLSTSRNADKIAVVDKGVVVEQGTYDELLRIGKDGHFYTCARKGGSLTPD